MEKIRYFLRALSATLAAGRMFPMEHPQAKKVLETAMAALEDIFTEREELILGIVEEELVFETETMFDLSALLKFFIDFCRRKGIEKIVFSKGVTREEMAKFIKFLLLKEEIKGSDIKNYFAASKIERIKVSKLGAPLEKKKEDAVNAKQAYSNLLDSLSQNMEKLSSPLSGKTNLPFEMKFTVFNIIENFLGRYQEFLNLKSLDQYGPDVIHSMSVANLAMFFGSHIGFGQDEVIEVGMASLLHDIGGKVVQTTLLDQEMAKKIYDEKLSGPMMLLMHGAHFGILPVVVAFEHAWIITAPQKKGLAYPQESHIATLVISLCCQYDRLTRECLAQEDYSPLNVHHRMLEETERFPKHLLESFFKVVGIWPTGSLVILSDGTIAVVREQNNEEAFYPKVEVIFPAEEKKLVDLRQRKGELTIQKALHPLGDEARKYVDLIS